MSDDDVVVFVHVPKAAGTTLNRFIEAQYNPLRIFTIGGYKPRISIDRFKSFSVEKRSKYAVVKGHGAWMLASSQVRKINAITVLRDPVDRVLSSYYYARSNPKHRFHLEANALSIVEYLTTCARDELMNGQVRAISDKVGNYDEVVDFQDLEVAKNNITEHFSVAGVSECFYPSVALMCYKLGWKPSGMAVQNVTPHRREVESLDADQLKQIENLVELDVKLYQWVKSRLMVELNDLKVELDPIIETLKNPASMSSVALKLRAAISRFVSI